MAALPLLPATVIGSWSFPGWYAKFCEDAARQPELFGADDREDALCDAGCLQAGDVYRDRQEVAEALVPLVNHEMRELVRQGVDFLQLDEPSFACHPDRPELFLDLIARTVEGVGAKVSMHLCFGNYRGR